MTTRTIPKRKVREFLERPRRDFRVYKNKSPEWLETRYARLPVKPPIWKKLHQDQRVCFIIGTKQPRFAFFNDPSTGKTLLSLALARYHNKLANLDCVLVLVPNLSNKTEWEREIIKHCPGISYQVLKGGSREKWHQLESNPCLITVETYAGLTRMVSERVLVKRKIKLKPVRELVQRLLQRFQGFVFDESSELKGYDSIIFRVCKKLTKTARMVLVLSGTPLGRDPTDLWSQMKLVDGGETLGETLGLFRAAFFTSKPRYFGGIDYKFDRRKRRQLHELIANRSIRYKVKEADLPAVNPIRKYVHLSEEATDWFERAAEDLYSARGDKLKVERTFLRMRQLSSGFIGVPGDEEGKKAKIVFDENPKLELLGSIVQSVPTDYPCVIFHEFIYSGERIDAELDERGISHVCLRGGVSDPAKAIRQFLKGSKQALVLNHKAGGFGLNLQNAGYLFFYESPVSSIMRRQTEMRVRRKYSEWLRIAMYDLIALKTMDETILEWHHEGGDLFQAILEGKIDVRHHTVQRAKA